MTLTQTGMVDRPAPPPPIKIGDLLYRSTLLGGYRGAKILDETKRHWIVDGARIAKKTLKATRKTRGIYQQWYTKQGLDDLMFVARWARSIGYEVGRCEDADTLRRVAKLIKMELK